MKKYLLGLFAVVLAIGFSAFTKSQPVEKKFATFYLQYNGSIGTAEKVISNYTQVSGTLSTCNLAQNRLCWIVVDDADANGTIDQTELDAFFAVRDTDSDDILSDQAEVASVLEKRAL